MRKTPSSTLRAHLLGDDELLRIESGEGSWYCTNCKADCGLSESESQSELLLVTRQNDNHTPGA